MQSKISLSLVYDDSLNKTESYLDQMQQIWPNFNERFSNSHTQRQKIASRIALKNLCRPNLQLGEMFLKQNQFLDICPRFIFSLAHTQEAAVAIKASKDSFLAIGVDIENKNRPVKDQILNFYKNNLDDSKIAPLALWVIKEAAYKCLYNAGVRPTFSNIHVQAGQASYQNNFCSYHLLEKEEYLIAKAWMKLNA